MTINKTVSCNKKYIDIIAEICQKEPSALMCFEKEPEECHRHLLAKAISDKTSLPIENLCRRIFVAESTSGKQLTKKVGVI
jgi:uncharacterized protein (DUF488 family)